jgi:hypothetical protein
MTARSISRVWVVRPHPTKDKNIVRPVKDLTEANKLLKQFQTAEVVRNIGSGEDVCFR